MNDSAKSEARFPKKLLIRIVSGVVLAPLMIAIVYFGNFVFVGLFLCAGLLALYEWIKLTQNLRPRPWPIFLGACLITIGICCFVFLRFGFKDGAYFAVAQMLAVWGSDTGAYLFGKLIGGKKMAPLISPNKTWAGLAGSVVCCGVVLWLCFYLMMGIVSLVPLFFGFGLGIVGQVGDLFVSSYKRKAGVKDTGQLIPGHGGLLDRIDAWLLISPFYLACIILWLG